MKQGFELADGKRMDVEAAFKDPKHPFRVAIVCAMWLTGFDVESLSTLYIDKPMRAHTLMQAIARANRRFPGKEFGLIVDYNGMLQSLRKALAEYALGDDAANPGDIVGPLVERVSALVDALQETEKLLLERGVDVEVLKTAKGFDRIRALADAVEVVCTSDETRRRFEILARAVFSRFKSLAGDASAYQFGRRHDDIATIYKKLIELRDFSDVTDVLKALHRIVNEAIRTHDPGEDHKDSRTYDLSRIDFDKLRAEFASKVARKATVIQDIRQLVEDKLAKMVAQNPTRMDFFQRYTDIIAQYNSNKDRVTLEDTFAALTKLVAEMTEEQQRALKEELSEDELALFDLMQKDNLTKAERERVKQASRELLAEVQRLVATLDQWTEKAGTQGLVETLVADKVFALLPTPAFSQVERGTLARRAYLHVLERSLVGRRAA